MSPFWGTAKGPTVILWDSLDEEGRTKSETIIRESQDWVVWARTRQEKNDKTMRASEERSKVLFAGSVREQNQNDEGDVTSGEGADKPTRRKGWWRRSDITTRDALRGMSCWTHEDEKMGDEAVSQVAAAWEHESSKDECVAQLEGNEEFCLLRERHRHAGRVWLPRSDIRGRRNEWKREYGGGLLLPSGF